MTSSSFWNDICHRELGLRGLPILFVVCLSDCLVSLITDLLLVPRTCSSSLNSTCCSLCLRCSLPFPLVVAAQCPGRGLGRPPLLPYIFSSPHVTGSQSVLHIFLTLIIYVVFCPFTFPARRKVPLSVPFSCR